MLGNFLIFLFGYVILFYFVTIISVRKIGFTVSCHSSPKKANDLKCQFYFLARETIFKKSKVYFLITKTCLYNFDPLKPHFYIVNLGFTGVYIIFLISAQNIDCGYSLEPPRRGGSNDYPQSMF